MLFFLVVIIALAADLYTKHLTLQYLQVGEFIPVGIFDIRHVHNTGAAFGMLANSNVLFVSVAVIVLVGMLMALPRIMRAELPIIVSLGLITGGTLGNLVDRLRFGYVVDFIDFRWWPVFNVADSCICVGVGILIWKLSVSSHAETSTGADSEPSPAPPA